MFQDVLNLLRSELNDIDEPKFMVELSRFLVLGPWVHTGIDGNYLIGSSTFCLRFKVKTPPRYEKPDRAYYYPGRSELIVAWSEKGKPDTTIDVPKRYKELVLQLLEAYPKSPGFTVW